MPLWTIQEGGGVMAAYIDREAAVESLNALKPFLRDKGQVQLLWRIMNHIGKIPAADVKPVVHGRWVAEEQKVWNLEIPVVIGWSCSACAKEGYIDFDYCPNCGAKMDGE